MLRVGPLDVVVGDPFGLTAAEVEGAGVTELVIYPHIDPIVALPVASATTLHRPPPQRAGPRRRRLPRCARTRSATICAEFTGRPPPTTTS